jgi:hypothetical protein
LAVGGEESSAVLDLARREVTLLSVEPFGVELRE